MKPRFSYALAGWGFCALSFALAQNTQSQPSTPNAQAHHPYAAFIAAAHGHERLNEPADARRWLDAAPIELRGWEWDYLDACLNQSSAAWSLGAGTIWNLTLSPDQKLLAAACNDGTIRLLDAETAKETACFRGHEQPVLRVAFSPDGKRLVSGSEDRTVRVWNIANSECTHIFKKHKTPIGGVAFSPDGARIASCSYEPPSSVSGLHGVIYIWSADADGATTLIKNADAGNKPLVHLSFSTDGSRIAVASWAFAAYLWNPELDVSPLELKSPDEGVYNAVDHVAFSPDSTLLAAAVRDRTARVWTTDSGELKHTLRGHDGAVNAVAFSHDGKWLATGSHDDTIRLWSTTDWSSAATLRGHVAAVQSLAWNADDSRIFSAGADGVIRTWSGRLRQYEATRMKHSAACYAVLLSPDARRAFTCGYDGTISVWDASDGRRLGDWKAHGSSCNTLSLGDDGKRLLSCSYDKFVRLWDANTFEKLAEFEHDAGIYHAALSPDATSAVATQDKSAWLWDVAQARRIAVLEGPTARITSLAFNRDGSHILGTTANGEIHVWNASTGHALWNKKAHGNGCESAAFSPDGGWIASAGGDGKVRIWDAGSGAAIRVAFEGDDKLHRVGVSPDGRRIAVGGTSLTIIDSAGMGALLRLRPHADAIWHLSFSRDGRHLATCSWDASISLLDSTRLARRLTPVP